MPPPPFSPPLPSQGILKLERAGSVGFRTGLLYLFTSVCASIESVVLHAAKGVKPSYLSLKCASGRYIQESNLTGACVRRQSMSA